MYLLYNQKRDRLAASCGFHRLTASCSKSVDFIKLQQICENQICCSLMFADFLEVVETTCIKLVDKKSRQSTCSKLVDNLQQTCYREAGASECILADMGLMTARQKACSKRAAKCTFLVPCFIEV